MDPLSLGATLYVPATRTDLFATLFGGRVPDLRSCVLCLEDAVNAADLPRALANVAALLARLPEEGGPAVFVRPRDPAMLARLLRLDGALRLAGFVLPKVTPETLPEWLALPLAAHHALMPTLETREAFDPVEMRRLRDQLLAVQDRVLTLRIGGNDLLQCLGLRRQPGSTAYRGPLGPMITSLAGLFLPYGFALSAPVLDAWTDAALLREEVALDLAHGLSSKTAIHPAQIPVIHAALAVPADQLEEARDVLAAHAPAVFARAGRLCEPATHRHWAEQMVRRAAMFGVSAEAGPAGVRHDFGQECVKLG